MVDFNKYEQKQRMYGGYCTYGGVRYNSYSTWYMVLAALCDMSISQIVPYGYKQCNMGFGSRVLPYWRSSSPILLCNGKRKKAVL